MQDIINDLEI